MTLAAALALLASSLAGCGLVHSLGPVPTPAISEPATSAPVVVQVLSLAAPAGASGRLELARTGTAYRGTGTITVGDDLGRWSFAYAPVKLDDPASRRESLQALGIRLQTPGDMPTVDWIDSALIDPAGRRHPMVHRGELRSDDEMAIWVSGGGLELLPPTGKATIALTLRRGTARLVKQFVFEWRPPEEPRPTAARSEPRPAWQWIGERFVVLPPEAMSSGGARQAARTIGGHAVPEGAAGVVLVVRDVKYDRVTPLVTFRLENTTQEYVVRAEGGVIEGLAPLADLETARTEWRGKTLWLTTPDLTAPESGSPGAAVLRVKRLAPVEVVDVQLGPSSDAPLRFVLRTAAGRVGFRDVHTSGTNVTDAERRRRAFETAFLTEDPRAGRDWPPAVWAAIEDGRVVVGMTDAQVRMSWGDPRRVERVIAGAGREERWLYADRPTLVLGDGLVKEVVR